MNILITGANGQLGLSIRDVIKGCETVDKYIFTDINFVEPTASEEPSIEPSEAYVGSEEPVKKNFDYAFKLDISDIASIREIALREKVSVIVNCAAYTDVERAEEFPNIAERINHQGAKNLAIVSKELGISLLHISTDYVFQGNTPKPLNEDDPITPLSVYGRSKVGGEEAIKEHACKFLIIRTSWLYSVYGNNFIKKMLSLMQERDRLNVVCDQIGTPTYSEDLAKFICQLLSDRVSFTNEIYHYSNEGLCSWYDFAVLIAQLSSYKGKIEPCLSSEYVTKAKRPYYSVLDKTKVKERFGINIPHWSESLKKCLMIYNEAVI